MTHSEQSVVPASHSVNLDQLISVFFRDLINEGMKRESQISVFLINNAVKENLIGTQSLADYNVDLIALNDLEKQSSVLDWTVDFIFTFNFQEASRFINWTLKTGGVVTVLLNDNPSAIIYKPPNYKIAYMRWLNLIAVAMWKTSVTETKPQKQRKLMSKHASSKAKKAALQKLEDVLLEPPRSTSKKSSWYLKRTRYLSDLMVDSLESYPHRAFIDMGSPKKDGGSKSKRALIASCFFQ